MALYLVTGGAGFIGSHIATALIARGDRVRVFDDLSSGRRENLDLACAASGKSAQGPDSPLELVLGDLTDAEALAAACEGVAGVFHEAAQVSVPQSIAKPARSYQVNALGTLHVLEGARRHGVPRVVFAASSAAYGDTLESPKVESMTPAPKSPYAGGKVAAEHMLAIYGALHGIRTVSLRYFNVFGPRQVDDSPYTGVIAIFARALLEGRRATIYGDGEQTRDFTYIDNVVQANLAAMGRDVPPGSVINVGAGASISVNQLYRAMAEQLGRSIEPVYAPARDGDVRDSLASLERARTLLGYEPKVGWREGLTRTVAWYVERHAQTARA
jgi:UDP-glucose 4-epimerase